MKIEEIRERSIAELQDEVTNLKKKLCTLRIERGLQKEVDAAEFGKLLQKVIQVMSKLELSTIDSFFNTLVTSNSLELGVNSVTALDPADAAKAQRATIDDYLDARTTEQAKREEFLKLFADLTGGKGTKTISKNKGKNKKH